MKPLTDVLLLLRSLVLFGPHGKYHERAGLQKRGTGLETQAGSVGVTPTAPA
mgnify:FL=1